MFHLQPGTVVRGIVVDTENQPVADATMRAGKLGAAGSCETKSGNDGTFELKGIGSGENVFTAEKQGYAATTVRATFAPNAALFTLVLQRGQWLRLRVVNQAGNPIAGANVWLDTLRDDGQSAAPLVQTDFSPITDQEGRVIWDSAPDEDLHFTFAAMEYMRLGSVKVHPDGQEHTVTMLPALVISGTVRDATTKEFIPRFKLVCGWPDHGNVARWSSLDRFTIDFNNGVFRHTLEETVFGDEPNCVFKIEADGYSPYVSRVVRLDEGEVHFDAQLQPAQEKTIKVVLPNGRPAAGADVGMVGANMQQFLLPGGLARNHSSSSGAILRTKADGSFCYRAEEGINRVVIAHPEGYTEAASAVLLANPMVVLQLWGRVEGVYTPSLPTFGETELLLKWGTGIREEISFDFNSYRVTPDAEGKFVWPQVPPGRFEVVRLAVSSTATGRSWGHVLLGTYVEVRPGQTTCVTLPGNYAVTARLLLAGGAIPNHAFLHTPRPVPPKEIAQDKTALERWWETPGVLEQNMKARSYILWPSANGTWTAEGVPSGGPYFLRAVVNGGSNSPNEPATLFFASQRSVTLPGDPPTGTVDLGEIELQPSE